LGAHRAGLGKAFSHHRLSQFPTYAQPLRKLIAEWMVGKSKLI
jgi:hypothetical protein